MRGLEQNRVSCCRVVDMTTSENWVDVGLVSGRSDDGIICGPSMHEVRLNGAGVSEWGMECLIVQEVVGGVGQRK